MPDALKPWAPPREHHGLSSIILVTYNNVRFTKACIDSIYEHTRVPFEIIVADNQSSDDTVSYLRSLDRPNLRVIETGRNHGFADGCNVGARAATGDFLVFLNNDTLLSPGWLERMLAKFDAHPGLGMVGPMTNVASNAQLVDAGHSLSPDDFQATAAILAWRHAGEMVLVRRMIGFCMVLPRAVWDACGPFEEAYGIGHYEDDDLCARLEAKGYKIAAARDAYVYHFAGQSFDAAGLASLANIRRKAFVFYRLWGNRYLDWPHLRMNLQDTMHVVWMLRHGHDEPPRNGDTATPFLVTAVACGPHRGLEGALAELYRESEIFAYAVPRSGRTLGEAFNAGIARHEAAGHLLVYDVAREGLAALVVEVGELGAGPEVGTVQVERGGRVVALYVTRRALDRVGPLAHGATHFDELSRDYVRRVRAAGLRTVGDEPPHATPGSGLLGAKKLLHRARGALSRRAGWWLPKPLTMAGRGATVNITMLSFNRLECTQQAIAALRQHTRHPYRLVVVDNGSAPETVAWLQEARARGDIDVLLLNDSNRGVAAGANQGWLAFETDYYVKLDNDIVIEKSGWLEQLVHAADTVEDAGMVGYSFEGRSYPLTEVNGLAVRPVVSLGGACVMITPRGHERAGFWCEDYFPYSEEDLDMCLRLGLGGLANYYLEEEHIGVHLPRGKATPLRGWQSEDDEGDAAYRSFKDQARRIHIGRYSTLWVNRRLYESGRKSLYARPGPAVGEAMTVEAERGVYRALRWLTTERLTTKRLTT